MVELLPDLPDNVIGFIAKGKVTAEDYETVLIPTVEAKLKEHGIIRLLYHLGSEFTGYSAGAMWDDAKVGLHHLTAWEKIAIVTDVEWVRVATKFFGFTMPCRVKVFSNDQLSEAKEWVSA